MCKWAVRLHSDTLKICHFDSRGGVTLHFTAGFAFGITHPTSVVPLRYILSKYRDSSHNANSHNADSHNTFL